MEYPLWLQVILALCMGLALAGLGAFMLYTFTIRLIRAALRLEDRRTNRETDALNNWKTAYDAEHEEHLQDVADLSAELNKLRRDVERKNALLAKVKVSEL